MNRQYKVGIIGLGYVGFSLFKIIKRKNIDVKGFDISKNKINKIKKTINNKKEVSNNSAILKNCNIFIVCVPTPITKNNKPDLKCLKNACLEIKKYLKKNDLIIFESTYYPGITTNFCLPLLINDKNQKRQFNYGYSPERYSPGDNKKIEDITKLISGENILIAKKINKFYSLFIKKTYVVKNIEIAEMAKNFENCQRDHNIALMNDLKILCDKSRIKFNSVIDACKTKWNFNYYYSGLVGGHCISVDPYYIMHYANSKNIRLNSVQNSRKINNNFTKYIHKQILNFFRIKNLNIKSKILFIGITYKKNIDDLRNSGSLKIYNILKKKYKNIEVLDTQVKVKNKYDFNKYKAFVLMVLHDDLKINKKIMNYLKNKDICFDPFNQVL